jgi:CRP-like cAMP-binding protein
LSGFAYRHKLAGDGARQILSIQIAGEFIDLQNSLLGYADHSVQALTRAEVAVIPKAALLDLAVSNPAVGRAMWLDTLIDASIFREWVVNVAQRDARARIAHLICEMATRLEAEGIGGRGTYPFPLTQEQLADATGLTAVHTNRVLQSLRKDGLISLVSQSLTILDAEQLQALGDFSDRYLHHAAA